MKRKIYNRLLNWKETQNGQTAILIDGARRVGKSYIEEEFARKEYKSFVLIDFSKEDKQLKQLFEDHLSDLDVFFRMLSLVKDVKLYLRESVIVFDEVQQYPLERQPSRCERRDGGIWHSEQKEKWFGEKFGEAKGKYGEKFGEKAEDSEKKGAKSSEKMAKSSEKILSLISKNPSITTAALADRIGISTCAVEKHLANLKAKGRLLRIGPDKGGHWEVAEGYAILVKV